MTLSGVLQGRRHGVRCGIPHCSRASSIGVPAAAFLTAGICNRDRGVPLPLLLIVSLLLIWTFVAKRTPFGRHVYAVGGNAEAARAPASTSPASASSSS